jgi:hypothetical protein
LRACCTEELRQRFTGIRCGHERFPDEEGVEAGVAEADEIGVGGEAGFGNGDTLVGDLIDQCKGSVDSDFESFEVAIVDADDFGAGGEGEIEFGLGVNLDERLHFEFAAEVDEFFQSGIAKGGDDEEEAVGVVGAGFPDLPRIEDKIFPQDGLRDFLAGVAEIFERAAEEFGLGEDGERYGAGGRERLRERDRIEWIANDAARGRSGFQFGDDVEAVAGERGGKIAEGCGGGDTVLEGGFGEHLLAVIDCGAARFEDTIENTARVGRSLSGHWLSLYARCADARCQTGG